MMPNLNLTRTPQYIEYFSRSLPSVSIYPSSRSFIVRTIPQFVISYRAMELGRVRPLEIKVLDISKFFPDRCKKRMKISFFFQRRYLAIVNGRIWMDKDWQKFLLIFLFALVLCKWRPTRITRIPRQLEVFDLSELHCILTYRGVNSGREANFFLRFIITNAVDLGGFCHFTFWATV